MPYYDTIPDLYKEEAKRHRPLLHDLIQRDRITRHRGVQIADWIGLLEHQEPLDHLEKVLACGLPISAAGGGTLSYALNRLEAREPNAYPYLNLQDLMPKNRQDLTSNDTGIYLLAFHDEKDVEVRGYVGKTSDSFQRRWRGHRGKGVNRKVQALMDRGIDFPPSILLNTQGVALPYRTPGCVQTQQFFYLEDSNHTDSHH